METVEQLDGGRVRLTVDVPAGEINHAVEHATHDLSDRVKIPGFRAGKVPPAILVQRIGKERVYAEAVDSHLSGWFWGAVRRNRLRPSDFPDFDYELPSGTADAWSFTAEFPVQGPADPADWAELEVPKLEVEVEDTVVDSQLELLQGMVAALSPVEGRPARRGDIAVVDIESDQGLGQRNYVVEIGTERLVHELEDGIRHLMPGEQQEVSWDIGDSTKRFATITLKELYERVAPPVDDELAKATSEFDSLDALRSDITERVRGVLEEEADARFRAAAVDELIKASKVKPAELVVEVRTRELLNSFIRQIESRGVDPSAYLQMMGISGADLEDRLRAEATQSIARELVLEGVADKLGIEVTDDEIRKELIDEGESEAEVDEFMEAGGADRVRNDLRLRRAVERLAAEVKPISQELATARESIWTPGKDEGDKTEKTLWTPGS